MEEKTITINRATKWAIQGFLGGALFGFLMANKAEESKDGSLGRQCYLNDLFDSDSDDFDSDDDGSFKHKYYDQNNLMNHPFKTISTSTSKSSFIIPTPTPPIYKNKMSRKPILFINTKKWISLPYYQNAVLYDFKEITHQSDKALCLLRKNHSILDISIQFMNKNKLMILVRYRNQEAQQKALQYGLSLFPSTHLSSSSSNDQQDEKKNKKKHCSVLYPTQILDNYHHHTVLIIKKLPLDDFQETELKIRQSILHPMIQTIHTENNNKNNNNNNNNDDNSNDNNNERLEILNIRQNYFPYGYYQGDVTVIIRGRVINQGPKTNIYLERYGNMYECQYIPVPVTLALV
ncbi:unnamed protein product [Cunninghamella blakesleeana]